MQNDEKQEIDLIDQRILDAVAFDGRISITALADKVGLSKSPCQVRLRRLQDRGYILGFRAVLNPRKLDLEHVAFVEVKLNDTTERALSEFNEAILTLREVEQAHMIAGPFDYLLKVRTANIQTYRRILGEQISALPHVANTSTYVSMEAVKDAGL